MTKLEKILSKSLKAVLAFSLMSFAQVKLSVDEMPKKYPYIPYPPTTIEEKLATPQGLKEYICPDERVLARTRKLIGTKVPRGEDICCWTAVKHVYDSAGVLMNCVYAVSGGESYKFKNKETMNQYEHITVGETRINGRLVIEPISPSRCLSTDARKKLDYISPGDILSYVFDGKTGHSVIFMGWKDKKNKIAELFDWRGTDSQGKMHYYQTFEEDIGDGHNPVFLIWKPRF
ncbi:MAG: hypothetical protein PHQ66_02795 [Candidatus Nanoarchaeia archaeon]|nr:hypothetical protein [Candidatus Nanoarchaeia archaeon]MDD5357707.1 hypothetical protein [Candidatus Nanoarchaeia archaeon]MDD5588626.1 hypothetical protein [Candidatus Nanoarchaeia archaeon]